VNMESVMADAARVSAQRAATQRANAMVANATSNSQKKNSADPMTNKAIATPSYENVALVETNAPQVGATKQIHKSMTHKNAKKLLKPGDYLVRFINDKEWSVLFKKKRGDDLVYKIILDVEKTLNDENAETALTKAANQMIDHVGVNRLVPPIIL
jgi:hypothetical protein